MTLEDAKALVRRGAHLGDVADQLTVRDLVALRAWFVREPGLPNLAARGPVLHTSEMGCRMPERTTYVADKPCGNCGSDLFVPGRCPTCANCGESSGGCA